MTKFSIIPAKKVGGVLKPPPLAPGLRGACTMTMTGYDCRASKGADPNLCLWVKRRFCKYV